MRIRTYLGDSKEENYVLTKFHEACGGILTTLDDYEPSDIAVIFGTYKKHVARSYKRGAIFKAQIENKLDTVIIETGYINRGSGPDNHYAVGLNGINGRADFKNKNSPHDRMEKLGLIPVAWRSGDHVLLCGQVPWDASCDFTDHREWLEKTARGIFLATDRAVVFRPHPLCKLNPIPGTIYSTRSLENDLKDAFVCVTFNSNTGVNSVMDGVPVIACDEGSMVYNIAGHSIPDIEDVKKPDRTQWLADLCYAQWKPDEFGEAWEHLKLM
jgi:hypothetical protein